MNKGLLIILIIGGIVNGANSFTVGADVTIGIELMWIANDLLMVLGLISVLLVLNDRLNIVGQISLVVAITAFAFIAGPSATIDSTSAYEIGAPIAALSLLTFALSQLKVHSLLAQWPYLLMILGLLISIVSLSISVNYFGILGRLVFSLGIIGLAFQVLSNSGQRLSYE